MGVPECLPRQRRLRRLSHTRNISSSPRKTMIAATGCCAVCCQTVRSLEKQTWCPSPTVRRDSARQAWSQARASHKKRQCHARLDREVILCGARDVDGAPLSQVAPQDQNQELWVNRRASLQSVIQTTFFRSRPSSFWRERGEKLPDRHVKR